MSRKWLVVVARVLAALIVIGLLVVGGAAVYRTGWSQGYMTGQSATGGEEIVTAPYAPHGFGYPGRHFGFPPFLFGAGLLRIGLFVLLLGVIGRIFHFRAWRMACGPQGRYWAGHRRWPHGPMPHGHMPRWCWGWEKPSEEAGPDAETGAAEAED
ncbi:MAG: hypothetical protein SWK90_01270 [Chloroflexota bacterium]|nr:hypothetical protein [Chloroflexota bacterium]